MSIYSIIGLYLCNGSLKPLSIASFSNLNDAQKFLKNVHIKREKIFDILDEIENENPQYLRILNIVNKYYDNKKEGCWTIIVKRYLKYTDSLSIVKIKEPDNV